MRRFKLVQAQIVMAFALLAACDSPSEPSHTDFDHAYAVWRALDATDYTFRVAVASSWTDNSGFFRVDVEDGAVIRVTDPQGAVVSNALVPTIDGIWEQLHAAKAADQLHTALFNRNGVPVEVNFGQWELDSGVHYSVNSFARAAP